MPILAILLIVLLLPHAASAATPDCTLLVYTPRGQVAVDRDDDVLVQEGEVVIIAWRGEGATRAFNREGDPIPVLGAELIAPGRNATYSYRFEDGAAAEVCSVWLQVVSVTFTPGSLVTQDDEPTIAGTATRIKSFRLSVENESGRRVASKNVRVTSGTWEAAITRSLDPGPYTVKIAGDRRTKLNTVASAMLMVQSDGEGSNVPLAVSGVALLTGGTAAPGSTIPVAYIKVENLGRSSATVAGFYLKESGSAPDAAVIGFETSDDLGGSRSQTGGVEGEDMFQNGISFVPLSATLRPGDIRIYTIKALISQNSGRYAGNQLRIDTVGIDKGAGMVALKPIQGTAWVLAR